MSLAKNNYQDILDTLPYYIDFVIPGFEKSYPRGIFKCWSFSNQSSEEWFLSFVDQVENAIGKRFLPIYRMSDGEFQFCVGFRYRDQAENESTLHYLLGLLRATIIQYRKKITRTRFIPRPTIGNWISGFYTPAELKSLRADYVEQLRQIVQNGFLALHFTSRIKSEKGKQFQQQYIAPVSRWLNKGGG